jgi:transposase InsO family protein
VTHARSQHPNAMLTPKGRKKMVDCVLKRGWTIEATAERFQVDAKTVTKWRNRFLAEGAAGLQDRSCRPHRSPNQTPPAQCRRVIELRKKRRWGADHIAHETGLAASTVQSILRRAGLARLGVGDRAIDTDTEPIRRYQRDRPGELVHVDIKKLSGIPDGGGWRIHGRGQAPPTKRSSVGYRFLHTAIDDRTRLAYSEILDDEQGITAAGFWQRAHRWFADHTITVERVLTDNGACYKSRAWRAALDATGVAHKRTRPYRPQTNGKVERFHRILLEEWAYIRDWNTDHERRAAYDGFIHFYNHHRSHGALGWATPIDTLNRLHRDNVPADHS